MPTESMSFIFLPLMEKYSLQTKRVARCAFPKSPILESGRLTGVPIGVNHHEEQMKRDHATEVETRLNQMLKRLQAQQISAGG
jgi:hypothetical protein